jgi:hypothetical protein
MAYTTEQEPYSRQPQPENDESAKFYLDDELRKIEVTLDRIAQILEEIDTRLTAGSL